MWSNRKERNKTRQYKGRTWSRKIHLNPFLNIQLGAIPYGKFRFRKDLNINEYTRLLPKAKGSEQSKIHEQNCRYSSTAKRKGYISSASQNIVPKKAHNIAELAPDYNDYKENEKTGSLNAIMKNCVYSSPHEKQTGPKDASIFSNPQLSMSGDMKINEFMISQEKINNSSKLPSLNSVKSHFIFESSSLSDLCNNPNSKITISVPAKSKYDIVSTSIEKELLPDYTENNNSRKTNNSLHSLAKENSGSEITDLEKKESKTPENPTIYELSLSEYLVERLKRRLFQKISSLEGEPFKIPNSNVIDSHQLHEAELASCYSELEHLFPTVNENYDNHYNNTVNDKPENRLDEFFNKISSKIEQNSLKHHETKFSKMSVTAENSVYEDVSENQSNVETLNDIKQNGSKIIDDSTDKICTGTKLSKLELAKEEVFLNTFENNEKLFSCFEKFSKTSMELNQNKEVQKSIAKVDSSLNETLYLTKSTEFNKNDYELTSEKSIASDKKKNTNNYNSLNFITSGKVIDMTPPMSSFNNFSANNCIEDVERNKSNEQFNENVNILKKHEIVHNDLDKVKETKGMHIFHLISESHTMDEIEKKLVDVKNCTNEILNKIINAHTEAELELILRPKQKHDINKTERNVLADKESLVMNDQRLQTEEENKESGQLPTDNISLKSKADTNLAKIKHLETNNYSKGTSSSKSHGFITKEDDTQDNKSCHENQSISVKGEDADNILSSLETMSKIISNKLNALPIKMNKFSSNNSNIENEIISDNFKIIDKNKKESKLTFNSTTKQKEYCKEVKYIPESLETDKNEKPIKPTKINYKNLNFTESVTEICQLISVAELKPKGNAAKEKKKSIEEKLMSSLKRINPWRKKNKSGSKSNSEN